VSDALARAAKFLKNFEADGVERAQIDD
jgi:hypothetical protein